MSEKESWHETKLRASYFFEKRWLLLAESQMHPNLINSEFAFLPYDFFATIPAHKTRTVNLLHRWLKSQFTTEKVVEKTITFVASQVLKAIYFLGYELGKAVFSINLDLYPDAEPEKQGEGLEKIVEVNMVDEARICAAHVTRVLVSFVDFLREAASSEPDRKLAVDFAAFMEMGLASGFEPELFAIAKQFAQVSPQIESLVTTWTSS